MRALFMRMRRRSSETRRKEIIRLVIAEAGRFPELAEFYYREVVARGMALLRSVAERAAARGELTSDELARFPQLIVAPWLVAFLWATLFERFETPRRRGAARRASRAAHAGAEGEAMKALARHRRSSPRRCGRRGRLWWLSAEDEGSTAFQGYIEGNLVFMAPEEGGRIEKMTVEPGDEVKEGQSLFALDSSVQIAQRNEAEAQLRQAEAQLANLKAAQQRPEQIAVLRAQEERAKAQLQFSRNEHERVQTLFQRGISAKAQLDNAKAAFDRDQAALEEAQRQILAAQLAGRSGEIDASEAAVRAADAMVSRWRQRSPSAASPRPRTPWCRTSSSAPARW